MFTLQDTNDDVAIEISATISISTVGFTCQDMEIDQALHR